MVRGAPTALTCFFVGFRTDFMTYVMVSVMGVATTTDTTDSVRTNFEVFKNLYGMSVQVDETAKNKKESTAAS